MGNQFEVRQGKKVRVLFEKLLKLGFRNVGAIYKFFKKFDLVLNTKEISINCKVAIMS